MPFSDFRKRQVAVSVLALVIAGAACIMLRLHFMRHESPMNLESHWRIHYSIKFRPKEDTIAMGWLALPGGNPHLKIWSETFSHSQLEVTFDRNRESHGREVFFFTPQRTKLVRFEAQVDVIISQKIAVVDSIKEDLGPKDSDRYLMGEHEIQVMSDQVSNTLSAILSQRDDLEESLYRIFSFCADMRKAVSNEKIRKPKAPPSDAASVIERRQGITLGKARAMVALCRGAHIPARLVTGFLCTDKPLKQPHHWVEAHVGGRWLCYDPAMKVSGNLGPEYVTLRRGQTEIIEIEEARDEYVRCSVTRKVPPRDVAFSRDNKVLSVLDFTNLPPRLSDAVSLILLLPLGGLVISIFSNVFGLKSFGYFIPALIGLSFVDVQWLTGIAVFIVILSIGLASRAILDRLYLNKMPRLTLVLVFVAFSLTIMVSLLDLLNIRPSPRALLLPMISLTMVIEQFHTRVEDQGYRSGFRKLGVTLLVAFCCWFLFSVDRIQWTFLALPESQFFIAAALVFVGSYKKSQSVVGEPSLQDG